MEKGNHRKRTELRGCLTFLKRLHLFYFVFLFCDLGIELKILCTPGNLKPADLARLAGGMCPGALLSSLPALREGDRHTAPSHLYSKHLKKIN